jgi:hypothetical protein
MATTGKKASVKAEKGVAKDKTDKAFDTALKNLEEMAKDRINHAQSPFKTGVTIARQIRDLAGRIEKEAMDENMALTEAADTVGMGIGVL